MAKSLLMAFEKETENKLRWWADVEGVPFKLYIPKKRVPLPCPMRLQVRISDVGEATSLRQQPFTTEQDLETPILAIVERVSDHSETVRYAPRGDEEDWQIGEPYIPYELLPKSSAQTLRIEVEWDRSADG